MAIVFLITELLGLTAASISAVANGYIITVFIRKQLPSPEHLRLALYLAIGDIGYAFSALIHLGYLATNWSDKYLDYNPYMVVLSNCFLPAHLKIVIVVSLSMAVDRTLAIYRPSYYRRSSRIFFANVILFMGFLWFLFDFLLQLLTAEFKRAPNCATMACFVNKNFLNYVSYSNTLAGSMIIVLSVIVFIGLRKMSKNKPITTQNSKSSSAFQQANRITVGILFASLFFVTIPSLLVTLYEEIVGISLFAKLGPFYIVAILVNGVADGLVFIVLNWKSIGNKVNSRATTVSMAPSRVANSVVQVEERVFKTSRVGNR